MVNKKCDEGQDPKNESKEKLIKHRTFLRWNQNISKTQMISRFARFYGIICQVALCVGGLKQHLQYVFLPPFGHPTM
jgi:hypothetical protein